MFSDSEGVISGDKIRIDGCVGTHRNRAGTGAGTPASRPTAKSVTGCGAGSQSNAGAGVIRIRTSGSAINACRIGCDCASGGNVFAGSKSICAASGTAKT